MAQPQPHPKNLQSNHNCASTVVSCTHSANDSAAQHSTASNQETPNTWSLTLPATISEKILHPFTAAEPLQFPKHIRDIETLTLAQLKKAYLKEYNSWRSRKYEASKAGIPFHPPWNNFSIFLRELGPIPNEGYTLDKKVPKNGYVPKNVQWASKSEQTYNRSVTVWLEYQGEKLPLGVWAKRTEQAESTLRWRKKQGWSDEEVVLGTRIQNTSQSLQSSLKKYPWPPKYATALENAYQQSPKGSWSYGGNYILDRIWFMLIKSSNHIHSNEYEALEILDGQGELYKNASQYRYTVSDESEAKLEKLNEQYQKFREIWRYAAQKYYEHTGRVIKGDDNRLKRY